MANENRIKIMVAGVSLALVSTDSPEYVEELGKMVESRIETIGASRSAANFDMIQRVMLAAMTMADEAKKAQSQLGDLRAARLANEKSESEKRAALIKELEAQKALVSELQSTLAAQEQELVSQVTELKASLEAAEAEKNQLKRELERARQDVVSIRREFNEFIENQSKQ